MNSLDAQLFERKKGSPTIHREQFTTRAIHRRAIHRRAIHRNNNSPQIIYRKKIKSRAIHRRGNSPQGHSPQGNSPQKKLGQFTAEQVHRNSPQEQFTANN
jgi:hypothetical protein